MIDFDKYLKQSRGGQPPRPSPSLGRIDFSKYLAPQGGGESSQPVSRGAYFTGGPVAKVFDVLRTGEYAVGGLLSRRPEETAGQAALRGVKTREESAPHFAVALQQMGAPDSFITDATAFAASVILDPINLVGIGLPGKALRGVGAAGAAAKADVLGAKLAAPVTRAAGAVFERVAPGAARVSAARKALEPTLDVARRVEARGVEKTVDLGTALRKDTLRVTGGNRKSAARLDEAVGLYFDAGADTMLNHIAQAQLGAEQAAQLARREATRRAALSIGQSARVAAGAVQQTAAETIRGIQGSVERALRVSGWMDEGSRLRAIDAAREAASRVLSEAGTFTNQSAEVLREAILKATGISAGAARAASDRAVFAASQAAAEAAGRGLTARQAEQMIAQIVSGELRGVGATPDTIARILESYQRAVQAVGSAGTLRRAEVVVANAVRTALKDLGTNDRIVQEVIGNYRKLVSPITRGRTQEMASAAAQGVRQTLRRTKQEAAAAEGLVGKIPFDPEVIAQGHKAALAAQEAWLLSRPATEQAFIRKWAPVLAQEDKLWADALVLNKMMKPETAAKWEGLHLRRIYQKFENPQDFAKFLEDTDPVAAAELLGKLERGVPIGVTGAPIPTGLTKQRKILTPAQQAARGVMRQASSRFMAEGTLTSQAVAIGEAYRKIATQFTPDPHIAQMLNRAGQATGEVMGYRKMPGTSGWGALADQWVPKEIHDILVQAVQKPDRLTKILETTTGWFKVAKVILNPATHMRNIRTNISLAHNAAGFGVLNPATWARAIKEVASNGALFREAKGVNSAFIDTFTKSELNILINDTTERGLRAWFGRNIVAPAGRVYQAEEQIGKMAVYITAKKQGLSAEAAGKLAEVALFDYKKVPHTIDRMRRIGIYPFITFPYKVATETLPMVLKRPGRMAQQAKVIGLTDQPLTEEEQRAVPAYMRRGTYIKLPRKVKGNPVLFDLGFELAFGDIAEAGTPLTALTLPYLRWKRGDLDVKEALRDLMPLLPPMTQIAAELILGRSAFSGRDIVPEGETNKEAAKILTYYFLRFATPGIVSKTVVPGGEFQRSVEAALPGGGTGVTPSGREALPLPLAAASTFLGLKTVPLDVGREQGVRAIEFRRALDDNASRLRAVARDQSITDEKVRQRRMDELRALRQRITERFQQTGTAIAP